MIYNGKAAVSDTLYGSTAEELNKKIVSSANGRNILNADMSIVRDGDTFKYVALVIYEDTSGKQLIVEG